MKHWTTALLAGLLMIVGCGGGGDGDAASALAVSLMPLKQYPIGTVWTYQVEKDIDRGTGPSISNDERRFVLGVITDPTGPDIYTFTRADVDGSPLGTFNQVAIRRTGGAWEVVFYENKVITAGGAVFGDLDVAVLMPGVRVAKDSMQPGGSFTNTLANEVTDYELKWIGPEGVTGYPDAHRFEFSLEIPDALGPFTMTGVAHVAPGVGPVRIVVDQTADFGTRKYTATLTDGPS